MPTGDRRGTFASATRCSRWAAATALRTARRWSESSSVISGSWDTRRDLSTGSMDHARGRRWLRFRPRMAWKWTAWSVRIPGPRSTRPPSPWGRGRANPAARTTSACSNAAWRPRVTRPDPSTGVTASGPKRRFDGSSSRTACKATGWPALRFLPSWPGPRDRPGGQTGRWWVRSRVSERSRRSRPRRDSVAEVPRRRHSDLQAAGRSRRSRPRRDSVAEVPCRGHSDLQAGRSRRSRPRRDSVAEVPCRGHGDLQAAGRAREPSRG